MITVFSISELLREDQQGGGGKIIPPNQIRVELKLHFEWKI